MNRYAAGFNKINTDRASDLHALDLKYRLYRNDGVSFIFPYTSPKHVRLVPQGKYSMQSLMQIGNYAQ